jgi:hypothetical protein
MPPEQKALRPGIRERTQRRFFKASTTSEYAMRPELPITYSSITSESERRTEMRILAADTSAQRLALRAVFTPPLRVGLVLCRAPPADGQAPALVKMRMHNAGDLWLPVSCDVQRIDGVVTEEL